MNNVQVHKMKRKKVNAAKCIKVLRKKYNARICEHCTSLQDKKKKGKCSFTHKVLEKKNIMLEFTFIIHVCND